MNQEQKELKKLVKRAQTFTFLEACLLACGVLFLVLADIALIKYIFGV